jgi:hypothetical protein
MVEVSGEVKIPTLSRKNRETRVGHPLAIGVGRRLLGSFLEGDGELGLAGFLGIVEGFSGAVGFRGFEVKAVLEAVGEPGEAGLAIDVGPDLQIELADAGESVGDVDLDRGGIDGFAGVIRDGEVGGAGAEAAIDRRDGVGIGGLGEGRGQQQQEQESSHRETL